MNERIKQLLIQSEVFNKDGTVLKDVTGYELKKFAKLIVKDCAKIASNADLEDVDGGDSAVLRAASEQIKEHFGVER